MTDLQKPTVQPRWLRVTAFSLKLFRYTCPQLVEKLSIVCGLLAQEIRLGQHFHNNRESLQIIDKLATILSRV